jgi:hypothetical protein
MQALRRTSLTLNISALHLRQLIGGSQAFSLAPLPYDGESLLQSEAYHAVHHAVSDAQMHKGLLLDAAGTLLSPSEPAAEVLMSDLLN